MKWLASIIPLILACAIPMQIYTGCSKQPENQSQNHKLLLAAADGDLARVKRLLDSGANIDYQLDTGSGFTPLLWAVYEKHYDLAIYLLRRGANAHIADSTGMHPIDFVATTDASTNADELWRLLEENGTKNNEQ